MFSENRYLTKRIHEELPLFLQLFLWNCIAELPVSKDYLQIFRLSGAGSQQIINCLFQRIICKYFGFPEQAASKLFCIVRKFRLMKNAISLPCRFRRSQRKSM